MQAGSESGRRPGRASSTSNVKENGNKKKDKESWKCEVCSTEAKKEDDKMVQCEYCSKYYCIVCLQISVSDYESFSNPILHWFCPKCESKVMKNVRLDHDLEARCSEFCKAVETRVAKLEKEIPDKASVSQLTKLETDIKGKADTKRVTDLEEAISEKTNVSQVEDLISTAIAGANASAAQSTSSSEIEESVNRKVVELRDSTMREKKLIIHGIEESIAEDAATKKAADTSVVKDLFEQD